MSFPDLAFRFKWRPYQTRILAAVEDHLEDGRVHIVAAPGAGKTCLGIEICRRLGQPALVLSPTRIVRDQWLSRLGDFTDTVTDDWTSRSLLAPAIFTSVTYQALHVASQPPAESEPQPEDHQSGLEETVQDEPAEAQAPSVAERAQVAAALREAGVRTIILDEAHHLRADWWRSLSQLVEALGDVVVVSLTGTPPYDALGTGWQRYETLCGPIDAEISVPELVKARTLCPHQDYVWASKVLNSEQRDVESYDEAVIGLCNDLRCDETFNLLISGHPWLVSDPDPVVDVRAMLDNYNFLIALLTYRKATEDEAPRALLKTIDLRWDDVEDLRRQHWQALLQELLTGNSFSNAQVHSACLDKLRRRMRQHGLLFRREVRVAISSQVTGNLRVSGSKVTSCVEVCRLERQMRGDALRQVILADFIRDDDRGPNADEPRLGAYPIFRALMEADETGEDLALLSGRLCLLPEKLVIQLDTSIAATRAPAEIGWVELRGETAVLTAALTDLLNRGLLRVVVSTRALLGEGWDCPVVNSLILATSVGSFMMTNQMRGRALRRDPANPNKVASIWHLVAFDPDTPSGYQDLAELERRFRTFVGLSESGERIESGFARLGVTHHLIGTERLLAVIDKLSDFDLPLDAVTPVNLLAKVRLGKLEKVHDRWRDALPEQTEQLMRSGTVTGPRRALRRYYFGRSITRVIWASLESIAAYTFWELLGSYDSWEGFLQAAIFACLVALLYHGGQLGRALWLTLRYLNPERELQSIGKALLEALQQAELIERSTEHRICVQTVGDGHKFVYLDNARFRDASVFADCMAELLGPFESPRYLLARTGRAGRKDTFAVPAMLGARKVLAEGLQTALTRYGLRAQLIATRGDDGRLALLRARNASFANARERFCERAEIWAGSELN